MPKEDWFMIMKEILRINLDMKGKGHFGKLLKNRFELV